MGAPKPKHGWADWLRSSRDLWLYFRAAEYPMARLEAGYEALKMAWRWP